jgi:hypothetical protein
VVVKDINVLEFETALVVIELEAWLFSNKLVLNTVKHAVLFHSSQQKCVDKTNIIYKDVVTLYSPNIKFLVITLTANLKWQASIDVLCKSLKKA